jgi:hypothetical protein
MSFQRRRRILVLLAFAATNAIGAQASRNVQLPADFVTAVLSSGIGKAGSPATFTLDSLPAGWPAPLVPRTAKLVGGAKTSSVMVAVFADTGQLGRVMVEQLFADNGFVAPGDGDSRGFSSGPPAQDLFCRGTAHVKTNYIGGPKGRQLFWISFENGEGTICSDLATSNALVLPTLSPPPGTTAIDAQSSATAVEVRSQVRLASMMPPSVIGAHYMAKLKAARWTVGEPAFSNTVAAFILEARDTSGRYWLGNMLITAVGDVREVQITMRSDRF